MEKYRISLTPGERNDLKMLVTGAGKRRPGNLRTPAFFFWRTAKHCPDEEIVSALGASLRTVEWCVGGS